MRKLPVAAAVLVALGLPIVELWQTVVLTVAWLAIATGTIRVTRARVVGCGAVLALVTLVRALHPVAAIQEGHNIFLVTGDGEVLERGLPPAVYREWRRAFEQQYPPGQEPQAPWRKTPPVTLYAASSDALWRQPKYSRVVDTMAFNNLTEFRGGFANDVRYNFFGEDTMTLARNFQADLPFFVMYEFSPTSVGSTLQWRGAVWWERGDGTFELQQHTQLAGRMIAADDVGRRAYAFNLPAVRDKPWLRGAGAPTPEELAQRPDGLAMRLILGPRLAAWRIVNDVLECLAVVALLLLTTGIAWRRFAGAAGLAAAGAALVALIIASSQGKYLGPDYPPHGGGDDGLSHESTGRVMAMHAASGDVVEALRGGQSIFYDTPGMRYFRGLEKLIMGDTNLGYGAFVALLPWFVYLLLQRLAGLRAAIAGTVFFLFAPTGSLSFVQYIQNAKLGYAEAAGFGFFVLGAGLLIRSQPAWGGHRSPASAFAGGGCLAAALFLRPNLVLASIAFGVAVLFAAWRARDVATAAAVIVGLGLALWMPIHNYVYGGELVMMTAAGTTISLPLSPLTYVRAAGDIIAGRWDGDYLTLTTSQVTSFFAAVPRLPVARLEPFSMPLMFLRWLTLAAAVVVALRIRRGDAPRRALAWAALASLVPMLFAFAPGQFRYAMPGWDLCAIVTIATIARVLGPRPHLIANTMKPEGT